MHIMPIMQIKHTSVAVLRVAQGLSRHSPPPPPCILVFGEAVQPRGGHPEGGEVGGGARQAGGAGAEGAE